MEQSTRPPLLRRLLLGLGAVVAIYAAIQLSQSAIGLILLVALLAVGLLALLIIGLTRLRLPANRLPAEEIPAGPLIAHIAFALIFVAGGFPLLFLPGLLIYALGSPFVDIVFGWNALDRLPMYGGLAVGFWVNIGWPWCLPVAYLIFRAVRRRRPGLELAAYLAVAVGWAIVVSFIGYGITLAMN